MANGAWAWTGVGLALGLPALAGLSPELGWPSGWALRPSAGLQVGNIPPLWTCAWLHLGTAHLLANLAGLGLILGLGWTLRLPANAALAWAVAWPLTHLMLLLDPRLDTYVGLSGVLHAGLGVIAVWLLTVPRRPPGGRRLRGLGALLLVGLVLKCWAENPHWQARVHRPDLGMDAAPLAHWAGALAGAVAMGVASRCRRCSKSRA